MAATRLRPSPNPAELARPWLRDRKRWKHALVFGFRDADAVVRDMLPRCDPLSPTPADKDNFIRAGMRDGVFQEVDHHLDNKTPVAEAAKSGFDRVVSRRLPSFARDRLEISASAVKSCPNSVELLEGRPKRSGVDVGDPKQGGQGHCSRPSSSRTVEFQYLLRLVHRQRSWRRAASTLLWMRVSGVRNSCAMLFDT